MQVKEKLDRYFLQIEKDNDKHLDTITFKNQIKAYFSNEKYTVSI